jgi:dihydroorotase
MPDRIAGADEERLTLAAVCDAHLHLRDGGVLAFLARTSARTTAHAVVMPNLTPPVRTLEEALAYHRRILATLPEGHGFVPHVTLYAHPGLGRAEIERAVGDPRLCGVKLYPHGVTTNSASGVRNPLALGDLYAALAATGLPLLVHGEIAEPEADPFDRERRFLDEVLEPLLEAHPRLRVVLEHITTREAVACVRRHAPRLAATITPHHLFYDRRALFDGALRPHLYCRPLLQRDRDRTALLAAATGNEEAFFLGTDSAPHERGRKECAAVCAGVFNAPVALETLAELFAEAGALARLEDFTSARACRRYGWPSPTRRLVLVRRPWRVPERMAAEDGSVFVPMRAGETLPWRVLADEEPR